MLEWRLQSLAETPIVMYHSPVINSINDSSLENKEKCLDRGQITRISDRFQVVLRKDAQRHQRATTELGEGHLRVPPSLEPPTLMGFGEERTLRAWVGTEGCHRGQESLCLGAASRACAAGLVLSPSAGGPHWSVSPRKSC
ncbi:unnamed protein product [Rangifer tarandus platyrhynchus]|uniref:Uncharacterized protein n=1 Tax=Rangifer tarandus platyrhynchus TaxID=3082113 RepID=A0AC59ZUY8_RANTA